MIATFTEKAAKELLTRISNELATRKISINVNEMYVGTFHHICLRILEEYREYTRLKKNYRVLDDFSQQYTVFMNLISKKENMFADIPNYPSLFEKDAGKWKQAQSICEYSNKLTEELVDPEALKNDSNPQISALGHLATKYQQFLVAQNCLDFSAIQKECYTLLSTYPTVRAELQGKIRYIMVDEYQDTNYIQEQLILLLRANDNICVVGDDDQGLYRFRGATIRNILEFPNRFPNKKCEIISLVTNYRSNKGIVDFYNRWMQTTSGDDFNFQWDQYRYQKTIQASKGENIKSPCVLKLTDIKTETWHNKILSFIQELRRTNAITDFNQIAFLASSVKNKTVNNLQTFLSENGIPVYSPRSDLFFKRPEIKTIMGCMMLLFPNYVDCFREEEYDEKLNVPMEKYSKETIKSYYEDCINSAKAYVTNPNYHELSTFLEQYCSLHDDAAEHKKKLPHAYSGLLYQLFAYEPFRSMLEKSADAGVLDVREARNLALFSQKLMQFEYLESITALHGTIINEKTEVLFNVYFKRLIQSGITEYEDDSEYAPSGCVSFMTIHQSKGMEFPIVFVGPLHEKASERTKSHVDLILDLVAGKYYHQPAFEPADRISYFDLWRKYYTAFSRAEEILILYTPTYKYRNSQAPSECFIPIFDPLPTLQDSQYDLSEFKFDPVKDVNLKNTFSFTSQISVYDACPRKYKFFKEWGFEPIRNNDTLFGTLVHETIEDIHKAALRGETNQITKDNIQQWMGNNYNSLLLAHMGTLDTDRKWAALNQVNRYVERQHGDWSRIQQAEIEISLVRPTYIMDGKIDLIRGENNTVELVDFKSERKPTSKALQARMEYYRQQLLLYAYLVRERTGQKVSKMHLYYTAEEDEDPQFTFTYSEAAVNEIVSAFDSTVEKILAKEFDDCANDSKTCQHCDFRFYCQRDKA